jgi:hypothetical protein
MAVKFNEAHVLLEEQFQELGLLFIAEFTFHPARRWRFDYLIGDHVAVEIEGSIWTSGRHTRGQGFQGDIEKYNHATMMGYRLLRFSTADVLEGRAKAFIQEHLSAIKGGFAWPLKTAS